MSTRKSDPALSFQFSVEVSGIVPITGLFMEIGGLETEHSVIEHKTVDVLGRAHVQMVPGRPRWGNVRLRRGVTDSMGFWIWHQLVGVGAVSLARAHVSIILYDRHYSPVAQWDLESAWPSKVTGPQIRADSSEVAVEEVTLSHEGISRSLFPGFTVNIPGIPLV